MKAALFISIPLWAIAIISPAQEKHHYQTDFPKEEFSERRAKVMESIGNNAVALIQGAAGIPGFTVFRQTNSFYYLTGLETAHSYLLINGKNKKSTVYLPNRDEATERNQGKVLSAEDEALVKQLTGIDQVKGIEFLSSDLVGTGL
ncbi:MAG TPA: aminopeptidase P N-terminal domain-containing protein, partial [Cyclobacteriaceae bacterium]|nr:aminopeptidase P N-terminal domain-containing protein [Cyclobacteriaceae bacterium]